MHYKYSTIMNLIFVAFFFGSVMPVLFPLCLVGLCVMYVVETLMIYYSYRKPPMYNNKITDEFILMLYSGPVVFVAVGAVAFTNHPIFQNEVLTLEAGTVYPDCPFSFAQFFTQLTPATPLVACFVVFVSFRWAKVLCPANLNSLFCIRNKNTIAEDFGDDLRGEMKQYTNSLKEWHKNAFNMEYFRDTNHLSMVKPGHARSVDFTKYNTGEQEERGEDSEVFMASTQNYDILMNGA